MQQRLDGDNGEENGNYHLGLRVYQPRMQNQMEEKMEKYMDTGIIQGLPGISAFQSKGTGVRFWGTITRQGPPIMRK